MSEPKARFPVALTIVTVLALAILIGLGSWQLKRLAWKQDLLARIEALKTASAVSLDAALAKPDPDFTRVRVDCIGLAAAPFAELYAVRDGVAGTRLISACPLGGGRSLLVDRGFVPDTVKARPPARQSDPRVVSVTGVLRAGDKPSFVAPPDDPARRRFFTRQVAPIAASLHASRPVPLFLLAETATNPEAPSLTPAPLPSAISNRHLEYALTWFGLAGALACVYAAMLWRRLKA